jgi:hypothetical protein
VLRLRCFRGISGREEEEEEEEEEEKEEEEKEDDDDNVEKCGAAREATDDNARCSCALRAG